MTQVISVKVDSYDKEAFEEFCRATGMSVSTAINMFIKNVNMNMELPFKVKADPFYNPANIAALRESIDQLNSGKSHAHDLIEEE